MTADRLLDADLEALAARVAALVAEQSAPRLLNASEAAQTLGVPETWLRSEQRAGRVPHVRLGHYVRFDRDQIIAWWQARLVGPVTGCRPVSPRRDAA